MNEEKPWWANHSLPAEPKEVTSAHGTKSTQRGVISVVSSFTLIVAAMVTFLVTGPNPEAPHAGQFDSIVYPANTESLIAQCGDTFTFSPPEGYYGALPEDFFNDPNGGKGKIARTVPNHPMRIPAYGYFSNDPRVKFTKKFYTVADLPPKETSKGTIPGIQRLEYLKPMWEGWKIIWYMPGIDETTKASIESFVSKRDDVVAIPWQEDTALPQQRDFAFSAWNVTRSCGLWDSDIAAEFIQFADEHNKSRDISALPKARLMADGELPLIRIKE